MSLMTNPKEIVIRSGVGENAVSNYSSDPVLDRANPGVQDDLPADILAEIFVLTLPVGGVHLRHLPGDAPWILLQVCSRWRQVALGEHRLWKSLVADISAYGMESWLNTLWPSHSNSLVSLDIRRSYKVHHLYDALVEHASRLRVLSIAKIVNVTFGLPRYTPLAFENLEGLRLGPKWTTQIGPGVSAALFGNVPKLRSLRLIAVDEFWKMGDDIPLHQLTDLTLSGATSSYVKIHLLLEQCPLLVRFTVDLGMSYQGDLPASDTTLCALEKLIIILYPAALLDRFLLHLVVPSLKILVFSSQRNPLRPIRAFPFPQRELIDMLDRSPHVEHLEIGCEFVDVDLIALTKKTPALTTLIIRQDIPGEMFDAIRSGEILPNLARLECLTPHPDYVFDLLECQCSNIDRKKYCGLVMIYIVFQEVEDLGEVRRRVEELEVQLHGIGDGRVLELKEHDIGGQMIVGLERSLKYGIT